MARRALVALALARSTAALQATQHGRGACTRVGAAPSLFDVPATDELETLEALEEALEVRAALYRGNSRATAPAWDAAFWQEFDADTHCADAERTDAAAGARLKNFLTMHRVLSLNANQRNRTEFVSRYATSSLAEDADERRVVSALHAYPGLVTSPKLELPAWASSFGQTVSALASTELTDAALLKEDASEDALEEDKSLTLDSLVEDAFGDGIMEEFGELVSEPLKVVQQDPGAPEDLAASLEALDAAYRDGAEVPDEDFSSELAELLDDDVVDEVVVEKPVARASAAAFAYGRPTTVGRAKFPKLLAALDGVPDLGPRHVALLAQASNTRTAPHSDLQAYTVTLYVMIEGNGGLVVDGADAALAPGEAVLLDTTFRHATYAGAGGARFLAVDVWHPSLTEAERAALTAFFALDEQFVLRRDQSAEAVAALRRTDRGLDLLEEAE